MRYLKQVDAPLGAAGAVAITSGQEYSRTQTGSDVVMSECPQQFYC